MRYESMQTGEERLTETFEPMEGIAVEVVDSALGTYLFIRSRQTLRTLNSSPWGGGFGYHEVLINRQVGKDYNADDPVEEMNVFLMGEGIQPDYAASMLTAARVKDAGCCTMYGKDIGIHTDVLTVSAIVTVGLGNKARAGHAVPGSALYPGTINSIVLIDGIPTDAAMVNAVITATEAKAAALEELGVRIDGEGSRLATGTTTDAVLIAATGRGGTHRYAGTATQLGYLIGRTVYESVLMSGRMYASKPY